MQTSFEELLSKKMTRKDFLVHIGLLFLTISGISGIVSTISNPNLLNNHQKTSASFGSGPYGGIKKV